MGIASNNAVIFDFEQKTVGSIARVLLKTRKQLVASCPTGTAV